MCGLDYLLLPMRQCFHQCLSFLLSVTTWTVFKRFSRNLVQFWQEHVKFWDWPYRMAAILDFCYSILHHMLYSGATWRVLKKLSNFR